MLIYCNDTYDELRKIHPGMADLKWVKNDLANARATVAMLDVPNENVYEFINSTREEIRIADQKIQKIIADHCAAGEYVFVYAYFAGHGCSDVRQYFMLNSSDPKQVLYNAEEQVRIKSLVGRNKETNKILCHTFAIYDICRLQSDYEKIKILLEEGKAKAAALKI